MARLDASDSLMYYGARYYDTAIGRFVQPDSLIDDVYNPQSLNRYSYVHDNPVRFTDPTGHKVDCGDDCGAGSSSTTIDPPASTGDNQGTLSLMRGDFPGVLNK